MTILLYLFLFLLGTVIGSFLNAAIWRAREEKPLSRGRSMCPHCCTTLKPYELLPVLSFIFLRGKCRTCKKPISWQYPLVEIITGLLFVLAAGIHTISLEQFSFLYLRDIFILSCLVFVFVYDFLYQEILDRVTTIPAIVLLPISWYFGWHSGASLLLGVLIGAGFFLAQFYLSRGKWVGGGDVRLGFFMGAILGFPGILLALLLAYIGGALWSVGLILLKKKSVSSETPFGTYLAIATVITMFWGEKIITWYLGFLR